MAGIWRYSVLAIAIVIGVPAFGGNDAIHDWANDLTPIALSEWNYDRAAHLLERAGFGGTPDEVQRLADMTPEEAVAHLVDYESIDASFLAQYDESGIWDEAMIKDANRHLGFVEALRESYVTGEIYGRKADSPGVRKRQEIINTLYTKYFTSNREWRRIAAWWANRMLVTPRPLEEKMTLFWHGHFATEEQKLDDYRLMLQQNEMLRRLATGNFRDMLVAVSQDPAMLVYLDNRKNIVGHANENYAREIMELFSLGIGSYTEDDIKEAARAFTGWRNEGLRFINDPDLHDATDKTVFGETGPFDGYDIIDLILEREACANHMSRKLYQYFVRTNMDPAVNESLAALLREHEYEFKPFLTALFLSRDFYSQATVGTQIKGPVEYYVSACRKLGLDRLPGTPYFTTAMANLGQSLGNPPNVKGWDGGRAWINPSTLMQRGNIMRHLLFPDEAEGLYPRYEIPERYRNAQAEAEQRDLLAAAGIDMEAESGEMMMEGAGEMKMTAPAAKVINAAPEYDLKLGVYNAIVRSHERVKAIPPTPAQFSLAGMVQSSGAKTAEEAVDYLAGRFLRVELANEDRDLLVQFLANRMDGERIPFRSTGIEWDLREVLHSIMSMPEFQLG